MHIPYWDVYPRSIKVTQNETAVSVPLSIRGNPSGSPVFESLRPDIAEVGSNGRVSLGIVVGATLIIIYDSEDHTSVRYIQVEVVSNNKPEQSTQEDTWQS